MSHTDMFNREKDLISEYLKQYPVLAYIMPSFTNNGINVSHRLHILRQGYWVLVQILNADNSNSAFIAASGKTVADNFVDASKACLAIPSLNLTKEDVELLSLLLQIVKKDFDKNKAKAEMVRNVVSQSSDVVFDLSKLKLDGNDEFKALLEFFQDDTNGLNPNKIAVLDALAASGVVLTPADKVPDTSPGKTAGATRDATVADIPNYGLLGTLTAVRSYPYSLLHTVTLDKLFPNNVTGATVPAKVTFKSIFALNGSVYLMCSLAQNSFTYSMGPLVKPSDQFNYVFEQNDNGLFVLKKMDSKTNSVIASNFDSRFAELAENNEFCRVFGAGKASKDPLKEADAKFACGTLINDCIGENTHNLERCRANFLNVEVPTKKFRGWNKLANDERRYVSYRILLGLGISGKYDNDGNLEFFNDKTGVYAHDDAVIKALIPKINDAQLEYVRTLMRTLGVIKTNTSKVAGTTRPSLGKISAPGTSMVLNPRVVGVLGVAGLRQVLGNNLNMIGGAQENNVSTIQYGGSQADITKITDSINHKIETLKAVNPRALPQEKEAYIRGKMADFARVASEVEQLEHLIVTYITLAHKYAAKDIVFTELEINAAKEEADRKKQQMSQKISKFEQLGSLMINKMAV